MDIGKVILIVISITIFAFTFQRVIEINSVTKASSESTIYMVEDKPNVVPTKTTDTSVSFEIPSDQVVAEILYVNEDYKIKINGNYLDDGTGMNNTTMLKNKYEGYLDILNNKIVKDSHYKKEYLVDSNGNITEVDYIKINE